MVVPKSTQRRHFQLEPLVARCRLPSCDRPSTTENEPAQSSSQPLSHSDTLIRERSDTLNPNQRIIQLISVLDKRHKELQNQPIKSTTLKLLPATGEPDPEDPSNHPYLDRLQVLSSLRREAKSLEQPAGPLLQHVVRALLNRVEESIANHELILLESINAYTKRDQEYKDHGGNAPVLNAVAPPNSNLAPIHQAFMLYASMLHVMLGVSASGTAIAMKGARALVEITLQTVPRGSPEDDPLEEFRSLLKQLPIDVETATRHLHLAADVTIFAACPACSAVYRPLPAGSPKPYQDRCSAVVNGRVCQTGLLRSAVVGDRLEWRAIRRYPLADASKWIASLYSRPGFEELLDEAIATPSDVSYDIWQSEYLANLKGPDRLPFCAGPGRLVCAIAIDWYNPFTNREAKKKWSVGAIYLVCLNLPPELRFRLENVCLLGIIPGPLEPSLEQVNNFLFPIVEMFLGMYRNGIWLSSTPKYNLGRLTRVLLALLLADLLGARHVMGFTFPNHKYFCSQCFLTKDCIEELEQDLWPQRDWSIHRIKAREWNESGNREERDAITSSYGLRYSPFIELPYVELQDWAPPDSLHMWLALLSKHARGAWHMNIAVDAGDGSYDPFHQPPDIMTMARAEHILESKSKSEVAKLGLKTIVELCLRRGIRTGGRNKKRLLEEIHAWRIKRGILDSEGNLPPNRASIEFKPPSLQEFMKTLEFETNEEVIEAAERMIAAGKKRDSSVLKDVRLSTFNTLCWRHLKDPSGTKQEKLANLRAFLERNPAGFSATNPNASNNDHQVSSQQSLSLTHSQPPNPSPAVLSTVTPPEAPLIEQQPQSPHHQDPEFVPVMGAELLREVRKDIEETIIPNWLKQSPKKLGDPKQGKLSSREWRSVFGVSFLVTLPRVWGHDYAGLPSSGQHHALDNFLHLVLASLLATQEAVSENVTEMYEFHIRKYLEGFMTLYPTQSIIPYHHLALHYPRAMRLLGPHDSAGTGPFEMFNGMSQKIPTNSKFGDIELTIMKKFTIASTFKSLVGDESLTSDLQPMKEVLQSFLKDSGLGNLSREHEGLYAPRRVWVAIPSGQSPKPAVIPHIIRTAMDLSSPSNPPGENLFLCRRITKSNMNFSISSRSHRDSQISYTGLNGELHMGRILHILVEGVSGGKIPTFDPHARMFVVVERYQNLSARDSRMDYYWNHPLIGQHGYKLCRMFYDEFVPELEIITTEQIVGHVARCSLRSANPASFEKPVIVTVQIDRGFIVHQLNKDMMGRVKVASTTPTRLPFNNGTITEQSNDVHSSQNVNKVLKRKLEAPEAVEPPPGKRRRQQTLPTPTVNNIASQAKSRVTGTPRHSDNPALRRKGGNPSATVVTPVAPSSANQSLPPVPAQQPYTGNPVPQGRGIYPFGVRISPTFNPYLASPLPAFPQYYSSPYQQSYVSLAGAQHSMSSHVIHNRSTSLASTQPYPTGAVSGTAAQAVNGQTFYIPPVPATSLTYAMYQAMSSATQSGWPLPHNTGTQRTMSSTGDINRNNLTPGSQTDATGLLTVPSSSVASRTSLKDESVDKTFEANK